MKIIWGLCFCFSLSLWSQDPAETASCTDCHSDLTEKQVMHYPADDACDNCHSSNGQEHPQEGVFGFELADAMPDLCFMCHETFSLSSKHAPVEMGECLMCHSPHASEHESLLLQANTENFCGDCHDLSMLEKKERHGALESGSCGSCHDPHESDQSYLLRSEKRELCLECHDRVREESGLTGQHYPFQDDCGNCHESHSSEFKSLLISETPGLCFECHEIGTSIETADYKHSIVMEGDQCAACHSPHASRRSGLLLRDERNLCLDCHFRSIRKGDRVIAGISGMLGPGNVTHGVFETDACSACHDAHASEYAGLLKAAFPRGLYASSDPENFALCFNCHDPALMEEENTEFATEFRDGLNNLHYLHMNGDKARSCKLCHNVHGSPNDALLADMVPFGNWNMPMGFTSMENGGSCNTGCHSRKTYLRE